MLEITGNKVYFLPSSLHLVGQTLQILVHYAKYVLMVSPDCYGSMKVENQPQSSMGHRFQLREDWKSI